MTFNFFRLVVLLTTPALRRAGAAAMALALLLWLPAGAARAAEDHFNGAEVAGCTRVDQTYTCATLSQANDITIANGYTVDVSSAVSFTYFQVLKMSGSAVLHASGDLDLRGLQTNNTQVAGGTLSTGATFRLGSNDQTVTANVSANAIATGGPSTRINGNVTVKDQANLGSSTTITGTLTAATVSAGPSLRIDGGIAASGTVSLSSNSTIKGGITGLNGARGGTVTTGSGSSISGNILASAFTLASGGTLAGDIDAHTVELRAANATVTGSITASISVVVGSGGSVTGKINSAKVELNASNVTIKGDINASTSLTISSGNTVNGNITGTTLTIASSNVVVNGNVTMTGDIDIGSGGTINGDISARNVTTHASGDNLNGNVAVNAIFLDWGASVSKTITCTGPGAVGCSCVTKADPNYKPTCGAAPPPSGVHHFRITHPGNALTCQPQPVTVTACANSDCTLPNYNGTATVTLQPGGKSFSFTGGETTSATVEQTKAVPAILSATGALNAHTCVNTSTSDPARQCEMNFATTGLQISASNHVSMAGGASVTIQALKATPQNQNCVPLVASQTVDVDLSCGFDSPVAEKAADTRVKVDNTSLDCRKPAVAVPLTFDKDGVAIVPLQYAEVGKVTLKGSYTGGGAGFNAVGSGSFIAAPKAFLIEAVNPVTKVSTTGLAAGAVFAKASQGFTVKISAVNAETPPRVTTNFGKELAPEGITITSGINNLDDKGDADAARQHGAITAGKFKAVSGGVYASEDGATGLWSFDDTGAIKLGVTLFNPTSYYMGHVDLDFKTGGALNVARFIPDHFGTVLMTNEEVAASPAVPAIPREGRSMSCAGLSNATRPCGPATTSFVHSGQPFFVKVLAYNGAAEPALTLNHSGVHARAVALSARTAAGGDTATPEGQLEWITAAGALLAAGATNFAFDKGVGKLAAPVDSMPRFILVPAYPVKDVLPVTTYLRAVDADGVSSKRPSPPAPAAQVVSVEAPLTVVSGRLLIANTYGSPNGSLPVDATAQYYMPVGYVFNPQVQVAAIAGAIEFENCLKALADRCAAMKAANSPATLELKNGKGTFRVAPPSPATTGLGSVDVSLGSLIYYLPSSFGRVTFGIYRSGPVIYRREVY